MKWKKRTKNKALLKDCLIMKKEKGSAASKREAGAEDSDSNYN